MKLKVYFAFQCRDGNINIIKNDDVNSATGFIDQELLQEKKSLVKHFFS